MQHPFFFLEIRNVNETNRRCPPHLSQDLSEANLNNEFNCVQYIKQVGRMLLLTIIARPATMGLSHAVTHTFLSTRGDMGRPYVPHDQKSDKQLQILEDPCVSIKARHLFFSREISFVIYKERSRLARFLLRGFIL